MNQVIKRWTRRLLATAAVCLIIGVASSWHVGNQLVAAVPRIIGPPPPSLECETVTFESGSGSQVVGWLHETQEAHAAILLLHSIRADRRSMVARANFLQKGGYHTLCMDFQAHGESPGEQITMGHLEAMDAASGVEYLRNRFSGLPVGVIGTSLGGAAALMADYKDPPDALVVEAMFADVKTAIHHRLEMRFGSVGTLVEPWLTCQIKPRLGIAAKSLSPASAASHIMQPTLVIYGSDDQHARPHEAEAIFTNLAGAKQRWEIAGAAHTDFHHFAGPDYERRVLEFFASNF